MRRTLAIGFAVASLFAATAVPAFAAHGLGVQTIPLNSGQEVGGGEIGASGSITLEFYAPGGDYGLSDEFHICYSLTTRNVSALNQGVGMHIHEAARNVNGPVVVGLAGDAFPTYTNGDGEACVPVAQDVLNDILDDPTDYYVNYHSVETPSGAIRGQLKKFN